MHTLYTYLYNKSKSVINREIHLHILLLSNKKKHRYNAKANAFCFWHIKLSFAARLVAMVSAAYGINLLYKRLTHCLDHRHTKHRQCLCRYVEDFVSAYLTSIRQEADLESLKLTFSRFLNCEFRPEPVVLQNLGINIVRST